MSKASLKTLGVLGAFLISATATPAIAGKPAWAEKSDATIVETAIDLSGGVFAFDDNGDDFDILVTAVVATGYNMYPLNGEDDYTVFAPIDSAFIALAEAILEDTLVDEGADGSVEDDAVDVLVGALGVGTIAAVLDYHVTEGVRNSRSVTRAQQITMLDGNTISAREGYVEAIGSDAWFEALDIRVSDGMIHAIDTVLLPF